MDPLGPLTNVIRGLWRARTERTPSGLPSVPLLGERTGGYAEPTRQRTEEELRERLRLHLAPLASAAPQRRYQAFVETVLLWELNDDAGSDPRFAEVVSRVVTELTADSRVSARLDEVLANLASA